MGAAFVFIFRSSLVMLAMYLVYKALLSGEKHHGYSRGLLLGIYAVSPVIVLLTSLSFGHGSVSAEGLTDAERINLLLANAVPSPSMPTVAPLWPRILIGLWIAGMAVVALSTLWSWLRVRRVIAGCAIEHRDGYVLALSEDSALSPFSTRHTVVMSRRDYEEAGDMILTHELCHIARRHWLDLVLARVVEVVAWFDPASWLMDDELRMVHEYQADAAVLCTGADARSYQMLLIKKAAGTSFPAIANSLNHSNLKKRITMMIKSNPGKGRRWRSLALVPAVAAVLAMSNLPGVASAMNEVERADFSAGKGSENSPKRETKKVTLDALREMAPESIESITVDKSRKDGVATVSLTPKDSIQPIYEAEIESDNDSRLRLSAGNPEIYIDGKKADMAAMKAIPTDRIAEIKVDKSDESRPNGVIHVTLKSDEAEDKSANVVLPTFPGGEGALMAWIVEHISYPEVKDAPEKARVVVQFLVKEDGSVAAPQIIKGSIDAYNKEALRVVGSLPKFNPATENGKPVACTYALPIVFSTK